MVFSLIRPRTLLSLLLLIIPKTVVSGSTAKEFLLNLRLNRAPSRPTFAAGATTLPAVGVSPAPAAPVPSRASKGKQRPSCALCFRSTPLRNASRLRHFRIATYHSFNCRISFLIASGSRIGVRPTLTSCKAFLSIALSSSIPLANAVSTFARSAALRT